MSKAVFCYPVPALTANVAKLLLRCPHPLWSQLKTSATCSVHPFISSFCHMCGYPLILLTIGIHNLKYSKGSSFVPADSNKVAAGYVSCFVRYDLQHASGQSRRKMTQLEQAFADSGCHCKSQCHDLRKPASPVHFALTEQTSVRTPGRGW